MKKLFLALAACAALVSCQSLIEEWQPVFTFGDNEPAGMKIWEPDELVEYGFPGTFTTIQDMKGQYDKKTTAEASSTAGHVITENIWIKGQVVSDDRTGNLYREIYLQDETGGIDLKLGKSSLYSDYRLGQWVYVNCMDLCIGSYKGMPQLGLEQDHTSTNEYETSYIDNQLVIDTHVFRGDYGTPVAPKAIGVTEINAAIAAGSSAWNPGALWGTFVEVSGLTYGNQIFALVYPHGLLPHKKENPENRIFLSDKGTWGITTWAMSKNKYVEYIQNGNFDSAVVGSGTTKYGTILTRPVDYAAQLGPSVMTAFGADTLLTFKEMMVKYATANYVSHYFKVGGTSTILQVRSSGYARFSDKEIPADILGGASVKIKGILTFYDGDAQISLLTAPDDPDDPSVTK
ncbi:MAG: DUF5689 domain-containing protein [Bacteroidales bacterium]|nr:DUF5689 domain-containing protein [Bacteroidales bacterium]